MKVLFVWPNKDSFGYKPIGLSILSAIARSLGHETRLFDTTEIDFGFVDVKDYGESVKICKNVDLERYGHIKTKANLRSRFEAALKEYSPDCIAFSVLGDEFSIASQISKASKEAYPDIPIIWGGKYPTLNPEQALLAHYADFACVGEGLDVFGSFLNALAGNGDIYCIPNIWAKKKGNIIKNGVAPLRKDLDALPYVDWEIFDKRHFYKPFDGHVYIAGDHMLNWGCPYRCTYCINHIYHEMYNNKYFLRRYGIKRIIKELKCLKEEYGLEFFKFHDEDFLMRPLDGLRELSEAYRQEINLPFVIEINAKSVTKEKVRLLKDMNCVSASIAIETGDAYLRNHVLERVDSEEDIVSAFALFKEAGIRACAFNMLGIPFETRQTYRKTVELNRRANVQYPDIGFFYPFDGTKLREISIREGFFDPNDEARQVYQRNKPALRFPDLSEGALIEMTNVFVLYVKLPECYEPFIERSEKQDELGIGLRKKLLEIYDKTVFSNNGWYDDGGLEDMYIDQLNKIAKGHNVGEGAGLIR